MSTYAELVAKQRASMQDKGSSFNRNAAPISCRPKKTGRGDTYRYADIHSNELKKILKTTIAQSNQYKNPKKFFVCIRCGKYVSKATRVNQTGFKNLLCTLHYKGEN